VDKVWDNVYYNIFEKFSLSLLYSLGNALSLQFIFQCNMIYSMYEYILGWKEIKKYYD